MRVNRFYYNVVFLVFSIAGYAQKNTQFNDVTQSLNLPSFNASGGAGHSSGVNLLDIDLDGSLDLFFAADENSPHYLILNKNGEWQVTTIGTAGKISRSAIWFDYDADGDLDVLVTNDCQGTEKCFDSETFQLFKSEGSEFIDVSVESGLVTGKEIRSTRASIELFYGGGIAAGDLNLDGYLDIVMGRWNGDIFLFMNNGNGTFRDDSELLGLSNMAPYFQPVIFDFTGDGWPDIYMTVDKSQPNHFLKNDSSVIFVDVAPEINLDSRVSDMGQTFGDYDNDGDYDFYTMDIERSGNIDGNRLFQNLSSDEEMLFQDYAYNFGVQEGGWGWGATFFDANNDGWLDLAATNGWAIDLGGFNPISYTTDQSKLWLSNAGEQFVDRSLESSFNDQLIGSALVAGDIDRDGDLDLVQGLSKENRPVHVRVLENQLQPTTNETNYLVVQPRMVGQNKQAIGANVEVYQGSQYQQRPIIAGTSFYGQEPAEAFFGLGETTSVDEIVVTWPGGEKTIIQNVSANQILEISDEDVLHTPGSLMATRFEEGVSLSWGHMSTFHESFEIQSSNNLKFDDPVTYSVSGDQLFFYDEGIDVDTYYYRVRAVYQDQKSKWSAITEYKKIQPLTKPSDLRVELLNILSVKLEWADRSIGEENFVLLRSLSEEMIENFEIKLPANSKEYTDNNVEPSTEYYYAVYASNENVDSERSNKVSVTTGNFQQTVLSIIETDELEIYPNPFNGFFTLQLDSEYSGVLQITLIDINSKIIRSWVSETGKLAGTSFSTDLLTGLYLLKVQAGKSMFQRKVILK